MAHDQEVMGSNPGTVNWMDVSGLLAITLKKNWKKVANRGTHQKKKLNKSKIKFSTGFAKPSQMSFLPNFFDIKLD
jgi:hypothetical protein